MSNRICHAILGFKSGCYFTFLLICVFSLGTCAAQQRVLSSVKPLPFSDSQDRRYGFHMRHVIVHGSDRPGNHLYVYDAPPENAVYTSKGDRKRGLLRAFQIRSRPAQIYRPTDTPPVLLKMSPAELPNGNREVDTVIRWRLENGSEPDVSDKETVLNLAKMSSDAYLLDDTAPDWLNFTAGFNLSSNFGWEDNRLRGRVFADAENSTVIIAIKGTSAAPGDDTTNNDKLNDNLLFSCCCASQRTLFGPVCNCRTDTFLCDQACLTSELRQPDHYYQLALEIYKNVTNMYPGSDVWLTGHSMGGSMSSLLGLKFGRPVVTFEAPPAALPAHRLGLPLPPGALSHQRRNHTGIYQFGNTADPIYMGACNGLTSACSWSGYAMESQCFTGLRCVYDTVGDKGWRLSILSHRINNVIKEVIEAYDEPAKCEPDVDCVDCNNWYFDNGDLSSPKVSDTRRK